eukprot:NODE_25_length_35605_cov_0.353461.p8 type:complete len:371 gc:universal NODE_25_length_35605_cov_0.353461:6067-7179(+)
MKLNFELLIFAACMVVVLLIHVKFTKYEWQHLMFKPLPLLYWTMDAPKFNFSEAIPTLNLTVPVGIVYLVYPKSLLSCYTSIGFLKATENENYPIEIWYHSDETSIDKISIFENVSVRNLKDYSVSVDSKLKNNYHFKSVAILNSNFAKVIYVDADALVLDNLDVLLELHSSSPVVAAQDYWFTPISNPIYSLFKVSTKYTRDMEAGFLIVDKSKLSVKKSLQMAVEMNLNHDIFYKYIWGDKDTFRIAFEQFKVDISWSDPPGIVSSDFYSINGNSMAHFFNNQLLVIHMTLLKDFPTIPEKPFSYIWQDHNSFFNLGTFGHFINPICVMPLDLSYNLLFHELRKEAVYKLRLLGYDVDHRVGDKYINF